MSAPTSLDGGAVARELARRVPRQRTSGADRRRTTRGPDRRRDDALAVLGRTHDELCTQAVDPSEVAAGLEAAGISDRQARREFGVASVFELAELLHAAVPRRPAEVAPRTDPWAQPVSRSVVRGGLYASPGLLYAMALGLVPAGTGLWLLVAATVLAAALGQGVSLLAHVLLGRGDARAAGQVLRLSLGTGVVLSGVAVALASTSDAVPVPLAALAGAQLLYLLAATALLVARADLLLLVLLAPGVAIAGLALSRAATPPRPVLLGALVLTLAAVVVAAWARAPRTGGAATPRAALLPGDRRLVVLHLAYGAVTAGLLSFPVVDLLLGLAPASPHAVALVMAPLALSLGVADRLVHRLRSDAWTALQTCTSVTGFRGQSARLLMQGVGLYALVLAALTAGLLVLTDSDRLLAVAAAACGLLGVGLLLAGLLVSLGRTEVALLACGTALALDTALRPVLADHLGAGGTAAQHAAVLGALLLALLPAARREFVQVTRHR